MIIFLTIDFLKEELNQYLRVKLNAPVGDFVVAGNISSLQDANAANISDKVVISLVNVEEDRISKNPENTIRTSGGVVIKNPKIFLNLYILFAVNRTDYNQALINLSYVVQFFQYHNVFEHSNSPGLPAAIEKLIPDLVTLNFEQLNQLWSVLGGKYIPSALYKARLVTVDEGIVEGEGGLIGETNINGKIFFSEPAR